MELKRKDFIFLAVLICAVFLIYGKTLHYDLIYDSKLYLTKGPLYAKDYPLSAAFTSAYSGATAMQGESRYYRPLTTLTFLAEKKLWGLKGANLRSVNITIFSLLLIALFVFLKKQPGSQYFPFITTGLFAFFPLNLDNIVWIVGRSDLFLMLFGILALLFLEYYLKKKKYYFLIFSSLFYMLGIFSKEAALFFIPVLFVYEYVKNKRITLAYHFANILITISFLAIKAAVIHSTLLKLSFSTGLVQNIKLPTAALGYYFKSIFYPFNYDPYLPLNNIINPLNILSGIIFLFILFIVFLAARKERMIFIPLSLVIFFLFGHLLLVYTGIPIFRVSSRFMMIPAAGFAWMLYLFLRRFKPLIIYTVFCALILSFIPLLLINASIYKNEVSYWQKFSQSFPEDGYVLSKYADALFETKPVESIFMLNKALKKNPGLTTFIEISFLYERIESRRGNYEKAFKWLEGIKPYANVEQKKEIAVRKAGIYLALGEIAKVEKILSDSIKGYDEKKYCAFMMELYHGFQLWEKAAELEKTFAGKFPGLFKTPTRQIKEKLDKFGPNQRLAYFLEYHNYKEAIEILRSFPANPGRDLSLVKLYYRHGKQVPAGKIVEDLVLKNPGNFEFLNSIGIFFLDEMLMADKAYFYFKKSLEIKKNQPRLIQLLDYLAEHINAAGGT